MSSRIELVDHTEFDPRAWLRREVLWASLMTPYASQVSGWLNGTEAQHHNGNISRRTVYSGFTDVESQSEAFFNHGKVIAALTSSAAAFRTIRKEPLRGDEYVTQIMLDAQAQSVDIALGHRGGTAVVAPQDDLKIFGDCTHLVELAHKQPANTRANERRYLRAAKLMSTLARRETMTWLKATQQDNATPLPVLTINNGGHPCSAGPRVEMLQPVFHQILESEAYLQFN